MFRSPAVSLVLVVAACGASSRPANVTPSAAPVGAGAETNGTSAQPRETPLVREAARRPMPVCHAGELQALATLSPGVAASAAIAARPTGGVIAYVTDENHDGQPEVRALRFDEHGAPRGASDLLGQGSAPAVLVLGAGYTVAWRVEGAAGSSVAHVDLTDVPATLSPVMEQTLGPGRVGPLAILADGDRAVVTAVREADDLPSGQGRAVTWLKLADGTHADVAAPNSVALDATRPPVMLRGDRGLPRVFVLAMRAGAAQVEERSLVELEMTTGGGMSVIARDVAAPAAWSGDGAMALAWTARISAHDIAARVLSIPARGAVAPWTVATFRGAYGAEVALLPIGDAALGAFTLSTLADDAGGSLNVSVIGTNGEYLGRQPRLTSAVLRSARVVAANAGESSWFALDARGDAATPSVLGLVSVRCSTTPAADPLEIPPPGLEQRVAGIEDPPTRAGTPGGTDPCTASSEPITFARHVSGVPDLLAGSEAAAVALPTATVLFATTREADGAAAALRVASLDTHGALSSVRTTAADATLLATGVSAGHAVALIRTGAIDRGDAAMITVDSRGVATPAVPIGVTGATSGALADDGTAVWVVGRDATAAREPSLVRVTLARGTRRATESLGPLRVGDRVLDVLHRGHSSTVLLSRDDMHGGDVSRALATIEVPDATHAHAIHGDPFADPLGYGRGSARLVPGEHDASVLYVEGPVLRAADLDHGVLRNLRSLVAVQPSGGTLLGASGWQGGVRWLAIATGLPDDPSQHAPPVTMVSVGTHAEIGVVSTALANDPNAIGQRAVAAGSHERIVLLYPHSEPDGGLSWRVATGQCRMPPTRLTNPMQHANGGSR